MRFRLYPLRFSLVAPAERATFAARARADLMAAHGAAPLSEGASGT